ncbi:helix-turn-helix transcriptional regulator [Actinospica robiniae]|uniref:helix-turn-helix transcriptional regulator n=1 Tax=Actinospica robiniae TaxID=304901 RepID=UPI00040D1E23|nr:helix-turn-helix transcriptional regulator [Actinospica robiniae]
MADSAELGEFLKSRRSGLRPEVVGLPDYGSRRRVPGLRREELAQLAGVSAAYYTRLEQGQSVHASVQVLEALADALRLTEDERAHLRHLADSGGSRRRTPAPRPQFARPGLRQLLAGLGDTPAILMDRRSDVLGWNRMGWALVASHLPERAPERPTERPNLQRMLFLDSHTRELYARWDEEAQRAVANLRLAAGRFSGDPKLAELVGELVINSPEFESLWSRHPVRNCTSGRKLLHHPVVGALELDFETLTTAEDEGQRLLVYTAAEGTPAAEGLALLAHSVHTAAPEAAFSRIAD